MKVRIVNPTEHALSVSASEIPVGRFATSSPVLMADKDYIAHLRVSEGLVRFSNDDFPRYYNLSTYEYGRFSVLPEDFSITLGGE